MSPAGPIRPSYSAPAPGTPVLAAQVAAAAAAASQAHPAPTTGVRKLPVRGVATAMQRANLQEDWCFVRAVHRQGGGPSQDAEAPFKDLVYDLWLRGLGVLAEGVNWQQRIIDAAPPTAADEAMPLMVWPASIHDPQMPPWMHWRSIGKAYLLPAMGTGDPLKVCYRLFGEMIAEESCG